MVCSELGIHCITAHRKSCMFSCIAGGDAAMEVETGAASAAGATAPSTAVEEDEDCHATYQLIGVLTHKVHV